RSSCDGRIRCVYGIGCFFQRSRQPPLRDVSHAGCDPVDDRRSGLRRRPRLADPVLQIPRPSFRRQEGKGTGDIVDYQPNQALHLTKPTVISDTAMSQARVKTSVAEVSALEFQRQAEPDAAPD